MKKTRKNVGTKAARDLVASSPHHATGGGQIPGLTDEDVQHESPIEKLAIKTLALCHDVTHIESQPVQLDYWDGETDRYYTPDFRVRTTFTDGDLYLEIKSIANLLRPSQVEYYGKIAADLHRQGLSFGFLVNAQLGLEPRKAWIEFLFRYTSSDLRGAAARHIQDLLKSGPRQVQNLIDCGCDLVDVWTLAARRHICVDWHEPYVSLQARVSLPNQPFKGLSLEDILGASRFGRFLGELALGRRTTDQRLMAAAANWRQPRCAVGPLSNVGGLIDESPLHSDRTAELSTVVPRYGSNQAAGLEIVPPTHTD